MHLNCSEHNKSSMKVILIVLVLFAILIHVLLLYKKCVSVDPVGRDRQLKYSAISGNSRRKHDWNSEEASSQLRIKLQFEG